jgi:hypothetical protein
MGGMGGMAGMGGMGGMGGKGWPVAEVSAEVESSRAS